MTVKLRAMAAETMVITAAHRSTPPPYLALSLTDPALAIAPWCETRAP